MQPIRVLVVDDSVVIRRLVADALSADPGIDVVGVAANGQIAVAKAEQLRPDAVTMDIEMPVMDGIEAVKALRGAGLRMPVVMFSTLTERGATATLDALAAGADDYVTKPSDVGSIQESLAQVGEQLVPRIKALVAHRRPRPRGDVTPSTTTSGALSGASSGTASAAGTTTSRATARPDVRLLPPPAPRPVRAVVVGSSTGGPEALSRVLRGITAPLPVPVLVVQHMPPVFTRQLAGRLDRLGPSTVVEAADGTPLLPGTVTVAAGDHHLEVVRGAAGATARLTRSAPVNFCRPSVDVLFRSAVEAWGGDVLAVVLTGMGADGRTGCQDVVRAGGRVLVQDEATSVVWGMPGAVAMAGLAHAVIPIDEVACSVVRELDRARTGVPA